MDNTAFLNTIKEAERTTEKELSTLEETSTISVTRTIAGVQVKDSSEETITKAKEDAKQTKAAMQDLRDRLQSAGLPCIATLPTGIFVKMSVALGFYRFHTKSGYVGYRMDREEEFRKPTTLAMLTACGLLALLQWERFVAKADPDWIIIGSGIAILLSVGLIPPIIWVTNRGFWAALLTHRPPALLLKVLWPDKLAEEVTGEGMENIRVAFRNVSDSFQQTLLQIERTGTLPYGIAAHPHAITFPDENQMPQKRATTKNTNAVLYAYNEKATAIISLSGEFKDEKALIGISNAIKHPGRTNTKEASPTQQPPARPATKIVLALAVISIILATGLYPMLSPKDGKKETIPQPQAETAHAKEKTTAAVNPGDVCLVQWPLRIVELTVIQTTDDYVKFATSDDKERWDTAYEWHAKSDIGDCWTPAPSYVRRAI